MSQDEETRFRSEAAKHLVDGWLSFRVYPAEKSTRSCETDANTAGGAASSSAPAASADSSEAAADPCQCDAVPDHGVKRVRWSPQVQGTRDSDPNASMETAENRLYTLTRVHDGRAGRRPLR